MCLLQSPIGKRGGNKISPNAKKGAPVPEPRPDTPKTPALSPDEMMQRQRKVHMCKEHKDALSREGIV